MQPNADNLLQIAGITTPLIGFYDVSDTKPFEPFTKPKRCFFSSYEQWFKGESICISINESSSGWWLLGWWCCAWLGREIGGTR